MTTDQSLQGRHAIITGASRGIGAAIARNFASHGIHLGLFAHREGGLETLREELRKQHGVQVETRYLDIGDPQAVKIAFQSLGEMAKNLDILVNNAGIAKSGLVAMMTPDFINESFRTNVYGPIYASQMAIRFMMRRKKGVIINMGSIMGAQGAAGMSTYAGTKAALEGISRSMAKELAPHGIRVNVLSPGFIDTDMTRSLQEQDYEKRMASIGFQRPGTPEEVANAALFLASDAASYISGQVLGVDGLMIL